MPGCDIYQVPIEEFPRDKKFDVISMINVFSHVPYFDRLYQSIHSLLNENGKVILKTGELRSDVRKQDIFDWGIPDHVHFLGARYDRFYLSQVQFQEYINTFVYRFQRNCSHHLPGNYVAGVLFGIL